MLISEVIARLEHLKSENGDLPVMFADNDHNNVWELMIIYLDEVLEHDEYPQDWNMPKGFKFIRLGN